MGDDAQYWEGRFRDAEAELAKEKARAERLVNGMKALRSEWLEENDTGDGVDIVTPFDAYLYSRDV